MADEPFTVRRATPADAAQVSRLLAETWHATYDAIWGAERVADLTSRWHAPDRLAAQTRLPDTTFLVAVAAADIVGTASARRVGSDEVMLDRLYVHPDAQGRGIGLALLETVTEASIGAARMYLEVAPENKGAIRFYERYGFTAIGATGDCGGGGDALPATVMSRPL